MGATTASRDGGSGLSASEVRKRVSTLRDAGWASASLMANRLLAFVAVVVVARLLPVDEFAAYLVAVAASTILVPLMDAGLWPVVARTASRDATAPRFRFTAEADRLRAPIWLVAIVISLLGSIGQVWPNSELGLLVVLAAIGQAELDTLSGELFGRGRFLSASALRIPPGFIGLAGAAALPWLGLSAVAAMAVFAASRVVPAVVMRLFVPLRIGARSIRLGPGLIFAATNLLTLLYINSDLLLLSAFGIAAAGVAVYGAAYRVVAGLQSVPGGIAMAIYPRAATAASGEAVAWRTAQAVALSLYISAALLAVIFLDLGLAFSIFGDSYAASVSQVRPLLLTILPFAVSLTYLSALQARDRERIGLALVGSTAFVNLLVNLVLIPQLGIDGALIATTTAEWIFAITSILVGRYVFGARPGGSIVLCGALVPVLLSFSSASGPLVSLSLVVWLAAMWWTDALGARSLAMQRLSEMIRGTRLRPTARL
jgi:O-antigen/teichoic acid export membrane protein